MVCSGAITKYELASAMGFDHGHCTVSAKTGEYFLSFFNEFMTLERVENILGQPLLALCAISFEKKSLPQNIRQTHFET